MVAIGALHKAADLAGLQGPGGILELLDHLPGGESVPVGVGRQAGVLAVGVHKLVKLFFQLGRVGNRLELGQQFLRLGLLLGGLLLGQGLAGLAVLGQQEDVLGRQDIVVLGKLLQVLLGGRAVLALLEHALEHVVVEHTHGADLFKAAVADAHALQVGLIGLLAAQLLLGGGQFLLVGGFVLSAVAVPLRLGLARHHAVQDRVLLGRLLDAVTGGDTLLDLHVPHTALVVLTVHGAEIHVGGVRLLGQPEQVLLCGDIPSVDSEHHGAALVPHHILHRVIGTAAAAEQAGRHGQRQRRAQDTAHHFLHGFCLL
ncbi:unknown [Firmicutes bacterium CAG:114]|nr:unknown [Firmicutes bacterium CAG:114]